MAAWLSSIVVLAFVMAATPGPNNVLFAAAGARQGYLRTLPLLGGMIVGFVTIITVCVFGVGGLIAAIPASTVVLTLVASLYMAYLAVRLWRAAAPTAGTEDSDLLCWWQMALFQVVNPKTLLAILAFVSGKLGAKGPGGAGADVLGTVVFLAVVWMSASLWALFGATLRSGLGPSSWTRTTRMLAVLAALTIPTFWW